MKKWIVQLGQEERMRLEQLVHGGKAAAYRIRHANVLLAVDQSEVGPAMPDEQVAKTLSISVRSIESLRWRFIEQGLDAALERKKRAKPSVDPMFDGEKEVKLIVIACGPKPPGRVRWTLELLARRVVILRIVEHCSRETVRRTLKKTK